jgi:hypothetical protein
VLCERGTSSFRIETEGGRSKVERVFFGRPD